MTNLSFRNAQTGKGENIKLDGFERLDWGFHFFVGTELEAYKVAYVYRNWSHGIKVEFAGGVGRWMVTVFNETAKNAGIDSAK